MINIVCALHCEAKPIINHYKLSLLPDSVFPIFTGEDIHLVVAGIGKTSIAAAMSYLFAKTNEHKHAAWLNYGIAGHKTLALGAWVNINKITEASTKINWYPSRFPKLACESGSLVTVDQPVSTYTSDVLCDMEASAFMAIALKFSSVELIQVLKLVSDNEENHLDQINKLHVQNLMHNNLTSLISLIELLQKRSQVFGGIYAHDDAFQSCLNKWHFTQYQKKQLERLIQRWKVLGDVKDERLLAGCKDAKQVIELLNQTLDNVEVVF